MNSRSLAKLVKITLGCFVSLVLVGQVNSLDADQQLEVSEDMFNCLTDMEKSALGDYFVSNILGNTEATLAVANSATGGVFPVGSLISLIPSEVMIKHDEGWNEATSDWEFFELDVSAEGSKIISRGTTEVINQFGGNCFGCHQLATTEWDLICGKDHGCAPLPIPRETILGIQKDDPRCVNRD